MAVKLERLDGQILILPITMRVEGIDFNSTVPTIKVEGHDGAIVDPNDVRIDERQIQITGILAADDDTPESLWQYLMDLRAFLASPYPYKVFVHEADSQYLIGTKQRLSAPFARGRREVRATISLVCADPFFYDKDLRTHELQNIVTVPVDFTVTNPGTAAVKPVITMQLGQNGVTYPKLLNKATGAYFLYTAPTAPGDVLVIDAEKMTVTKNGQNALAGVALPFFANPIVLSPGANAMQFTDDAEGGHNLASLKFEFRPRYF